MDRKTSTLMSLGISMALIAAGIWFLYNHHDSLGYGARGWIMPFHIMMGSGRLGIVAVLFWIVVFSAIGLLVSGLISNHRSAGGTHREATSDTAANPGQHHAGNEIDKSRFEIEPPGKEKELTMNPKKRIMEFLNDPGCRHTDENSCTDCQKVQEIIDGMSMGTASLVIDQAVSERHTENYAIDALENKGRYYTARIVDQDGGVIHRLLVDKQTGDVRFV